MEATMEQTAVSAAPAVTESTAAPAASTPSAPSAEPEINADFVSNMKETAKRRDVKTVREQFEKVNRGFRERKKTENKVEAPATTPDTKAPNKTEIPKGKYVIGDGEGRIELDDPDGFLGYKTSEELKKAAANQVRRIQMDKKWLQEAEQKVTTERQRADSIAAELAKLKSEIEKTKTAATAQPVQPKPLETLQSQFQIAEMPTPPVEPGEDAAPEELAKFKEERALYEKNPPCTF